MKKTVFALTAGLIVLGLSISAFADTTVDSSTVVAKVTGYQEGITEVTLYSTGRLTMKDANGVQAIRLNVAALGKLLSTAINLSSVEVKTEVRKIVCEMMMRPIPQLTDLSIASDYDYQTSKFAGDLRLVLSAQGCWMRSVTAPVEDYALNNADRLRDEMVTLALAAHKQLPIKN